MGFKGIFTCDVCKKVEEATDKENYRGTVKRYDAELYLCDECRSGLHKVMYQYLHPEAKEDQTDG